MINKNFIIETYGKFQMLGYNIGDDYKKDNFKIDWNDFFRESIKLLNQAASFNDAAKVLSIDLWCIKNYHKIDRMFYKKWYEWHTLKRDNVVKAQMIKALSPAAIRKQFTITNVFKQGEVVGTIASLALPKPAHIVSAGKYYYVDTNKRSTCLVAKRKTAKLIDINTKLELAQIGLDSKGQIILNNNNLTFDFVNVKGVDYAFDREYLNTIRKNKIPNVKQAIASIAWDSLSKEDVKYGLAIMTPIDLRSQEVAEQLFLIATSTFLILNKQLKIVKSALAAYKPKGNEKMKQESRISTAAKTKIKNDEKEENGMLLLPHLSTSTKSSSKKKTTKKSTKKPSSKAKTKK